MFDCKDKTSNKSEKVKGRHDQEVRFNQILRDDASVAVVDDP